MLPFGAATNQKWSWSLGEYLLGVCLCVFFCPAGQLQCGTKSTTVRIVDEYSVFFYYWFITTSIIYLEFKLPASWDEANSCFLNTLNKFRKNKHHRNAQKHLTLEAMHDVYKVLNIFYINLRMQIKIFQILFLFHELCILILIIRDN